MTTKDLRFFTTNEQEYSSGGRQERKDFGCNEYLQVIQGLGRDFVSTKNIDIGLEGMRLPASRQDERLLLASPQAARG